MCNYSLHNVATELVSLKVDNRYHLWNTATVAANEATSVITILANSARMESRRKLCLTRRGKAIGRSRRRWRSPKGGVFKDKVEQGRYGPIFPKTPACYGFSIIAKIIPGREPVFYEYAKNIEKAVADQPDFLAVLKLHYLRWELFHIKGETYFIYRASSTPTSTNIPRMRLPSSRQRYQYRFRKSRGLSQGLEDECPGVPQVRS